MDKKNTTIGVLFVLAAFAFIWFGARHSMQPASPAEIRQAAQAAQAQGAAAAPAPSAPAAQPAAVPPGQPAFASATPDTSGAEITTLENNFIEVNFTTAGGAIRDVALKKYPAALGRPDPYILNRLHADPMLALVDLPGLDPKTRYALVSKSDREVVYRATLPGKLEVTRRYIISPSQVGRTDPYQLRAEITFRNLGRQAEGPMQVGLVIGTSAPSSLLENSIQLYQLATGYWNGHSDTFIRRSQLESHNGFFGVGASEARSYMQSPGPVVWAATKNQFFCTIYTADVPGTDLVTRRVKLMTALPDSVPNAYGLTATEDFQLPALPAGGTATLGGNFYAGANEYNRLSNVDVFKANQDRVMQFGMFRFFSEVLLTLMTWIHGFIPNWGVAIVCTTLLLRSGMMMFTIPAARSARRMQKIQPELKALKEKYKDNAQKQQMATMELFKKHKVNPLGGCLPMIVTLPLFWGFYKMLECAPELRFAHFLWVKDLSMPDTIASFGHGTLPIFGTIDINLFPILMAGVTYLQMGLTPQPTVDSSQAKMMKLSPLFMLWIYYSYSCALSVYSTANGLFMIFQQILVNRMKDDGDPTHHAPPGKQAKGAVARKR